MFVDITELKQAELAKEQAYRAKDVFFAKISHELRTPLNAIIGFSGLLREEKETITPEEQLSCISSIQRGGYDLLHIVDHILPLIVKNNDNFRYPLRYRPWDKTL